MADKNTADIGFEKQIWNAACVLRGNLDASEYKSVVLGLIFLKYISDRFDEKYKALLAEGDGFEEDIDEYTSEGIFFVPADARWSEIARQAHTPEIGAVIDNAMRAIEKENKRLKDILPKNFARPELDKRRLYLFYKSIRPKLVALGNGSVFTNLKTDILKGYSFSKPDDDTLYKFDKIVAPMFRMMREVARENQRLSEVRDSLLPKLMSGELDISDLNI